MTCNIISALKDIFLIRLLERIIVVDHISHSVVISLVRYNPDMILKRSRYPRPATD